MVLQKEQHVLVAPAVNVCMKYRILFLNSASRFCYIQMWEYYKKPTILELARQVFVKNSLEKVFILKQ